MKKKIIEGCTNRIPTNIIRKILFRNQVNIILLKNIIFFKLINLYYFN